MRKTKKELKEIGVSIKTLKKLNIGEIRKINDEFRRMKGGINYGCKKYKKENHR